MKYALALALIVWSSEVGSLQAFRYDFYSENELVRENVDEKVCKEILTGFYERLGQPGNCERKR
jgi:hypothetical protein